jgi:hypothetical protein
MWILQKVVLFYDDARPDIMDRRALSLHLRYTPKSRVSYIENKTTGNRHARASAAAINRGRLVFERLSANCITNLGSALTLSIIFVRNKSFT